MLQVQYLGDKGGTTVYETVGLVMRELLTSRLGMRFNMKGAARHQKLGLRPTKLFVVIYRELRLLRTREGNRQGTREQGQGTRFTRAALPVAWVRYALQCNIFPHSEMSANVGKVCRYIVSFKLKECFVGVYTV